METKEQEAKEAWRKETRKFIDPPHDGQYYLMGIEEFQTTLIEALEKEIENEKEMRPLQTALQIKSDKQLAYEKAISLVKTVTPKKK